MTEQHYRWITGFVREHPFLHRLVRLTDRYTPYLVALMYFLGGILLLQRRQYADLPWYFGLPAFKFVLVTVLRKLFNFARPYDVYHFDPIGRYEPGKGKSFPSRHTASAFAIARAMYYVEPAFLGLGILLATSIGMLRIITGKHFPRDVIAAAIFII